MLTDASIEGKIDRLNGLKENVIIGKLIPAATGLKRYRNIEISPSGDIPRETYERQALLAALEEIGSDGGGLDLSRTSTARPPRATARASRRRRSPRSTRRSTRRRPSPQHVRREARETGPLGILAPTGTVPDMSEKDRCRRAGTVPRHVPKGQVRGKRGQSPAMSQMDRCAASGDSPPTCPKRTGDRRRKSAKTSRSAKLRER